MTTRPSERGNAAKSYGPATSVAAYGIGQLQLVADVDVAVARGESPSDHRMPPAVWSPFVWAEPPPQMKAPITVPAAVMSKTAGLELVTDCADADPQGHAGRIVELWLLASSLYPVYSFH